ncbi:hypothetical protein Q8A67_016223 [Cirrhinus molitorella]|uniref:Uncharacterized protein n=1 Tax=Cirrhinus molitorella TaxID=172907 RepID=A0AA88PJ96_9TELE|nr:hypothetical protein Q8A67_016223 [Cirrhinus molitorella]
MVSSRKRKYDLPERIHADSQSLSDCVDSTIQNPLQRCVYPADSASGESSKCVSVEMSPLFKQSLYNEWSGEVEREMTLELGERAGERSLPHRYSLENCGPRAPSGPHTDSSSVRLPYIVCPLIIPGLIHHYMAGTPSGTGRSLRTEDTTSSSKGLICAVILRLIDGRDRHTLARPLVHPLQSLHVAFRKAMNKEEVMQFGNDMRILM